MKKLELESMEPIVLSGPSGVGKTYLAKHLAENYQCGRLISTTSRPMRPLEQDMLDSHFLDERSFNELDNAGGMFLCSRFFNASYGFEYGLLQSIVEKGETPLIEVYTPKITNFLGVFPLAKTVFLAPPSNEYLAERLLQRQESDSVINYRLQKAQEEMDYFEAEGHRHYQQVYTAGLETFTETVSNMTQTLNLDSRL